MTANVITPGATSSVLTLSCCMLAGLTDAGRQGASLNSPGIIRQNRQLLDCQGRKMDPRSAEAGSGRWEQGWLHGLLCFHNTERAPNNQGRRHWCPAILKLPVGRNSAVTIFVCLGSRHNLKPLRLASLSFVKRDPFWLSGPSPRASNE